jgi:hypothetical protein
MNQLAYLNRAVLDALDQLLTPSDEPQPVVVVMSDHGAVRRTDAADRPTADYFANLMAIRTPSDEPPIDADGVSPVNLLSTLFNRYFGSDIRLWPNSAFPADAFGGADTGPNP